MRNSNGLHTLRGDQGGDRGGEGGQKAYGPSRESRNRLRRPVGHLGALLFCIVFPMSFWIDFHWFSIPTWLPKYIKIVHKSMSRSIPSWILVLNRFLFDFCSQFGPAGYEKSSPRCSQSTIFEKSPVHVNIDFWFHFGANVAPFWGPKYTKTHLEINPKRHQQKWSISGSIFWASWLHFEAQVGAM